MLLVVPLTSDAAREQESFRKPHCGYRVASKPVNIAVHRLPQEVETDSSSHCSVALGYALSGPFGARGIIQRLLSFVPPFPPTYMPHRMFFYLVLHSGFVGWFTGSEKGAHASARAPRSKSGYSSVSSSTTTPQLADSIASHSASVVSDALPQ